MTTRPVVGLGQCSWDLLGRVAAYPQVDEKIDLQEYAEQGGGPVATALVTLARLGLPTAFLGTLGGDHYAASIREGLRAEGVDVRLLQQDHQGTSQVSFIAVDPSGRRTIFCHKGARRPFSLTPDVIALIESAAALLLDGGEAEAALAAARLAKERGIPVLLDGGSLHESTRALLPYCSELVVSEKFARQLTPDGPETALELLLQQGARTAVVTLGAQGSLGREVGGELVVCQAFPAQVVDTTGCGDVFHGAYLYALLRGDSLLERLRFASVCAALKALQLGGRSGIPRLEEVQRSLAQANNYDYDR